MQPKELIRKKRDGKSLSAEEITNFVFAYTKGEIPDYQASAFLMAVFFKGLSFSETKALTKAMLNSGKRLNLTSFRLPKIDKHSTGGVGDKISLVLFPLVSACGLIIPSFAGRSLGHTGGTIDKLESIPNFRTNLSEKEILSQLRRIGLVIVEPTEEICPADKKIYALRDATETVESLPLIAGSILSKKLAEGIDGLILDVKVGKGAFLKNLTAARRLAKLMIKLSKEFGVETSALLTNMDEPLGRSVGNSLEIMETIEALKGNIEPDIKEITFALGEEMLILGKVVTNRKEARKILEEKLMIGEGLKRFQKLIEAQGGDVKVIEDYRRLPQAKYRLGAQSLKTGYLKSIPADIVSQLLIELGGGRKRKEDTIDPSVGFLFLKKRGGHLEKGEIFAEIYCNDEKKGDEVRKELEERIQISERKVKKRKLIYERL